MGFVVTRFLKSVVVPCDMTVDYSGLFCYFNARLKALMLGLKLLL